MEIILKVFYKDITTEYLDDRKNEISEIEGLIQAQDFENIEKRFHRISGSAQGFGLNQVTQEANRVLKEAKNKNIEGVKEYFSVYRGLISSITLKFEN